jgi:hypothetical protein
VANIVYYNVPNVFSWGKATLEQFKKFKVKRALLI